MREVDVDEVHAETFDDDRGGFIGSTKKRTPGLKMFCGVMAIIIAGLIIYAIWPKQAAVEVAQEKKGPANASALPSYKFQSTPGGQSVQAGNAAHDVGNGNQSSNSTPAPTAPAGPVNLGPPKPPEKTPQQMAMERRLKPSAALENRVPASAAPAEGKRDRTQTSEGSSALASRLKPARIEGTSAGILQNPSFTLARGTSIPCGATTELDTTVPGMVSCQVSRDVYSADGKVKLIDKGAKVEGEVSGGIKFGQARVFVLWTRVRNPDQTIADLDSPGTNRLGSSGVPGQVDTHFWERFKDAMFISVFTDGTRSMFQALANSTSNTETSINLDSSSQTSDSLAREALQATMNIPPTLITNFAEVMQIRVARDVDFSNVYGLSLK